jgi:predicted amidohydrolase
LQLANIDATSAADRDANLAAACTMLRANPGYDVYVFPEMSAVGYSDDVLRHAGELAEDADTGPSARAFAPIAKEMGAFIVYGFPRRDDVSSDSRPTISQSVMGPDGVRVAT